jgi:hypothetical protein
MSGPICDADAPVEEPSLYDTTTAGRDWEDLMTEGLAKGGSTETKTLNDPSCALKRAAGEHHEKQEQALAGEHHEKQEQALASEGQEEYGHLVTKVSTPVLAAGNGNGALGATNFEAAALLSGGLVYAGMCAVLPKKFQVLPDLLMLGGFIMFIGTFGARQRATASHKKQDQQH